MTRAFRPSLRHLLVQIALFVLIVGAATWVGRNVRQHLRERGIATGLSFLWTAQANFVISETFPIPVPDGGLLRFAAAALITLAGLVLVLRRAGDPSRSTPGRDGLIVGALIIVGIGGAGLTTAAAGGVRTISYVVPSTYGIGLVTGLFNTLKISILCIAGGTAVGLVAGVARLSRNVLLRAVSGAYVEVVRNVPLLLQVFFWYFAVLAGLPGVRQSLSLADLVVLNNRGVFLARPVAAEALGPAVVALIASSAIGYGWLRQARRSGAMLRHPVLVPLGCAVLVVALPGLTAWFAGSPIGLDLPGLEGFNYTGGLALSRELAAMLIGLTLYSGAFVAEIVRSGLQAVPRGQTEAALSLGLTRAQALRLVLLPQARRIMLPPLTATYLGTVKNSSLGVAVGYPELVSVGGTILDASGHAIEIVALTAVVYMITTLLVSGIMSRYGASLREVPV